MSRMSSFAVFRCKCQEFTAERPRSYADIALAAEGAVRRTHRAFGRDRLGIDPRCQSQQMKERLSLHINHSRRKSFSVGGASICLTRRGRPTVPATGGLARAVLCG